MRENTWNSHLEYTYQSTGEDAFPHQRTESVESPRRNNISSNLRSIPIAKKGRFYQSRCDFSHWVL